MEEMEDRIVDRQKVNLSHPLHAAHILKALNENRKNPELCDGVIVVQGEDIPVQRSVLAAASQYFRGLFSYGHLNQNYINSQGKNGLQCRVHLELPDISINVFKDILEYIYTSVIVLSNDNIQDVLQASDVLLLNNLKELCCDYLEQCIAIHNCLGIRDFAERFSCPRIFHQSTTFIDEFFSEVSYSEEFLQLSKANLQAILKRESLLVAGESVIYDSAIRWVKHDEENRKGDLSELITSCIHMNLMEDMYVHDYILHDPLIKKCRLEDTVLNLCHTGRTVANKHRGYMYVMVTAGGEGRNERNPNTSELKNHVQCIKVPKDQTGGKEQRWLTLAPLLQPRSGHGLVEAGGCLYAVGGRDSDGRILNTGEKYSVEENCWVPIPPMSHARVGFGLVAIDDKIYAIGGSNDMSDPLTSIEEYNIYTKKWRSLPEMNLKRAWAAYAVAGKKIFVIGGGIMGKLYESVECFNPRSESWTSIAPMRERRFDARAVGYKNNVYVFGGLRRLECPSARYSGASGMKFCGTEVFVDEQRQWLSCNQAVNLCTMTQASRLDSVAICGDEILVIGSLEQSQNHKTCVRGFNPITFQWRDVVDRLPPDQRNMPACVLKMPNHVYYTHLQRHC